MARARFKPNTKQIGAMMQSQKMEREMVARARLVVSYAQADAPHRSGGYAESFEIDSGQTGSPISLGQADRAWAKVKNTAVNAAAVEFGNKRVGEGQRVLGRAVDRLTGS